jgi:uncharacterized protein (TIGR02284 family)
MTPIRAVQDLIHLDMDAIKAYEQAIKACEHENVASQLRSFQSDHQRHVNDLSEELRKLGEQPDVRTDIKGFFIEAFTAVTSHGTRSALLAMRGNEQLTTARYKAALDLQDLPDTTKEVIRKNYADEQRHLEWIKMALDQKIWEQQEQRERPEEPARPGQS